MADIIELKASSRERTGKGAARIARREGLVPAVIYGDKKPPEPIQLPFRDIRQYVQSGHFLSTVYMIELDGKTTRVIPRDVQLDPIRDFPVHVDFLRLGKDASITVAIPIHIINEELSPGMKRGGVLNIVRHEIDLVCPADAIPESLDIDISELDIGDSLHSSALNLPEKVKHAITDRDFTVVTIAGRLAEEAEETESEEDVEDQEQEEDEAESDED